jgi:hypothetical protein
MTRPHRRMRGRRLRWAADAGGLLAFLVGLPIVLAWWAGNPLPDPTRWRHWISQPLTPTGVRDGVAIVVWVGWLLLVYVVAAAVIGVLARVQMPIPRLAAPLHTVIARLAGAAVTAIPIAVTPAFRTASSM